jgi:DNA-binding transcriptional ArsR family regulator
MPDKIESTAAALRALSNPRRLAIVCWLADPVRHFPPQRDGDLVEDGVCVGFITKKIGLSQPAVTEHMQVLASAEIVTSGKIKNWVFYKLDNAKVSNLLGDLANALSAKEIIKADNKGRPHP